MQRSKFIFYRYIAPFLTIAMAVTIAYWNLSEHNFLHWDDVYFILEEPRLHELSWSNLKWMFFDFNQIVWQPITNLSFAINFSIWGANPLSFKAINIVIHTANCALVYLISLKIFSIAISSNSNNTHPPEHLPNVALAAFISAILFAVHPQHVESVIWIIERKDVLCAFFYFSGILTYIKQIETHENRFWVNATAACFIFAMMSKPMAITFPFVLILMDIFLFNKSKNIPTFLKKLYALAKNKSVLIFASLGFSVLTLFSQNDALQDLNSFGISSRIINSIISLLHYFYSTFFPSNLSPYYNHSELSTEPTFATLLPLTIFGLIIYILIRLYQNNFRFPLITFIFYFIMILPVVGLVKVGHAAYADRYTYIPSISLHMLTGYVLVKFLLSRRNFFTQYITPITVAGYIAILLFTTFSYVYMWRTDEALWTRVNRLSPYKAVVSYLSLGSVYYRNKQYNTALSYFLYALGIDPNNIDTLKHLAKTHNRLNNKDIADYYFISIASKNPQSPRAHIVTGNYYFSKKLFAKAKYHFDKALQLSPTSVTALFKNAVIDYVMNNTNSALEKSTLILQLKPEHLGALQLVAQIKYKSGDIKISRAIAKQILAIDKTDKFANDLLAFTNKNITPTVDSDI